MKKKQKTKSNMLKTLCMAAVMVFGTAFFTSTVYAAKGDVKIDSNHFPDELFRQKVSSDYDKNKDGVLSKKELQAVKEIEMNDVDDDGDRTLKTVKGIEYFSNLEDLTIYYGYSEDSDFQNLDISKNKKLKYVDVDKGSLKKLDVSKNPELVGLHCNYNKLTTLDISKNPKLETLHCKNNKLTTLDISKNPELYTINSEYGLSCDDNVVITK